MLSLYQFRTLTYRGLHEFSGSHVTFITNHSDRRHPLLLTCLSRPFLFILQSVTAVCASLILILILTQISLMKTLRDLSLSKCLLFFIHLAYGKLYALSFYSSHFKKMSDPSFNPLLMPKSTLRTSKSTSK